MSGEGRATYSTFPLFGSVAWGTMRTEDVYPRLLDALRMLDESEAAKQEREDEAYVLGCMMDRARGYPRSMWRGLMEDARDEACSDITGWLFDCLEQYAPDGHSFGANEGDGSDYGFWPHMDTVVVWATFNPHQTGLEYDVNLAAVYYPDDDEILCWYAEDGSDLPLDDAGMDRLHDSLLSMARDEAKEYWR